MSFILEILFFLFLKFYFVESYIEIKTSKGLTDIYYNSTSEIMSFKIPLKENCTEDILKLSLSYPYKSNRTPCSANCEINRTNINDIFYECKIDKTECDLLEGNKKIIIDSILEPSDYEFDNKKTMLSVINFETTRLDMVCANYKLSFFLIDDNLQNHPYEDIFFNFPIYYKDKMETAECIFPKQNIKIPCTIDASNRLFEKGYFVKFEFNKSIVLTKDLNLTLKLDKYILEDDCGKDTNNIGEMIYFKIYHSVLLFFFLVIYK